MGYNPLIHHRRSIRLKGYDYSLAGAYFITMCCHLREHYFGFVQDDKMFLNEHGKIAHDEWLKTPYKRPNIELGEFVVMPNHFHGIIFINDRRGELHSPPTAPNNCDQKKSVIHKLDSDIVCDGTPGECNSPLRSPSQTVGAIVRGYKGAVTGKIQTLNNCDIFKLWQRNFHEHIIRDQKEYENIAQYIINNPARWNDDLYFKKK